MEIGITSAQRGRIPLDHGNYLKMAGLQLLVKISQEVNLAISITPYSAITPEPGIVPHISF